MENKFDQSGSVSWEVFNDLYETYYDLMRKIRFFVEAGRAANNESLAMEMLGELIAGKQGEIEKVRRRGIAERDSALAEADFASFGSKPNDNPENGAKTKAENRPDVKESIWNRVKQNLS